MTPSVAVVQRFHCIVYFSGSCDETTPINSKNSSDNFSIYFETLLFPNINVKLWILNVTTFKGEQRSREN